MSLLLTSHRWHLTLSRHPTKPATLSPQAIESGGHSGIMILLHLPNSNALGSTRGTHQQACGQTLAPPWAGLRQPSSGCAAATVPWEGHAPTSIAPWRPRCPTPGGSRLARKAWTWPASAARLLPGLVLRTANTLARWARGSVAVQAPIQRVELGRDVCRRVLARCPRPGGPEGAPALGTGRVHRQRRGRSKAHDPQQVPAWHGAGHHQGHGGEWVTGEGVPSEALQGILRRRRQRASPREESGHSVLLSESPVSLEMEGSPLDTEPGLSPLLQHPQTPHISARNLHPFWLSKVLGHGRFGLPLSSLSL
jgi:hypothetical protein